MTKFFKSLWQDEDGATAIEYGLLAALIAVAIIITVTALGGELNETFAGVETDNPSEVEIPAPAPLKSDPLVSPDGKLQDGVEEFTFATLSDDQFTHVNTEMLPVAIQVAENMRIDPRSLVMCVTFAASCSFMTPLEPSCILVWGPGRYRFLDFVKVGGILTVIVFLTSVTLIPVFWPMTP